MEKLLIILLIVKAVTLQNQTLQCYQTDTIWDEDLIVDQKENCTAEEHGCLVAAFVVKSHTDAIIRARSCAEVSPRDDFKEIERITCLDVAEKIPLARCAVIFCFEDLCNEYRHLRGKPMSEIDESYTTSKAGYYQGTINNPSKVLLFFVVIFCEIKY